MSLLGTTACAVDAEPHIDTETSPLAVTPLADAARVSALGEVCPPARTDALCTALRAGDVAGARTAAAALASSGPAALTDGALRYHVRERQVALLVWNALTDLGRAPAPADYAAAADAFLDEHFPAYRGDDRAFAMARRPLAPVDGGACASKQALVIFPGVLRLETRTEFSAQAAVIRDALPCLEVVVVDTDNFMDPAVNAEVGRKAIAGLDPAASLHLVGYSQGATNALTTLVDHPAVASRVRSVLTMNSAAHGSEVADTLFSALVALDRGDDVCTSLPAYAQPTCAQAAAEAAARGVPTAGVLMEELATAFGFSAEQLEAIGTDLADLRAFFAGHAAGARSLTTAQAAQFWARRAPSLPRHVLYTSFRSVITDVQRNLPPSNALFFPLLERAGGDLPYNDMQVLLPKQSLGGPVAGVEVVLPVAEGNHWQWQYTEGEMADALMPPSMTDRVPQRALLLAYAQSLLEAGLLR